MAMSQREMDVLRPRERPCGNGLEAAHDRRPLPPMDDRRVFVPVKYPYRVVGTPKGCRNERELWVWGMTTASMPMMAANAGVAYLLHYPPTDHRRGREFWVIEGIHDLTRATVELQRDDEGVLWWPQRNLDRPLSRYDEADPAMVFAKLADGADDLLALLPPEIQSSKVVERPEFRSIATDQQGEAEAMVHRKLARNYRYRDGRIFARGGVPVLVAYRGLSGCAWLIQIASAGPDRAVDPRRLGLRTPPGDQTVRGVVEAIKEGRVWGAGNQTDASANAHPLQADVPKIDILHGVREGDPREHLIVDALYREALTIERSHAARRLATTYVGTMLAEVVKQTDDTDSDTTRRRRAILRPFVEALRRGHWKVLSQLAEQHAALERAYPCPPPGALTPDEEEMIASLGNRLD